jgi:signal transduction histidine kinase
MMTICVLMVTLIVIQIYGMLNAHENRKNELRLRYNRALDNAANQLSSKAFCFESFSKVYLNPKEQFTMLHLKENGTLDTINIYYDGTYSKRKKTGKLKTIKFELPISIDIQLNSYVLNNDTPLFVNSRLGFNSEAQVEKLTDAIRSYRPIDSLIDMHFADSLIRLNLNNEHLPLAFGFGFINTETNQIAYTQRVKDSSLLLQSKYSTILFKENRFLSSHKLAIAIPQNFKLIGMNYVLLLSIVIILILTFSFFKFVQLYFKQIELTQSTSDFIQNLTHEFNTPLANIALALETIDSSGKVLEKNTQNLINIIESESIRLRENIERSLQVGMMENNALILHKEEVDLVQLMTTVISSYSLKCESLGGSIHLKHQDNLIVYADETHLLNCIVNLVENAIKYRKNEPIINIDISKSEENVLLSISDNGIGMDPKTQKHIFEKFYRAHQGNTHNTKGFGLGLCYVKGVITAHKGSIEVWSKKGVGSKFVVKLPLNQH